MFFIFVHENYLRREIKNCLCKTLYFAVNSIFIN